MLVLRFIDAATFGIIKFAVAGNARTNERSVSVLADLIACAKHVAFVEVCGKNYQIIISYSCIYNILITLTLGSNWLLSRRTVALRTRRCNFAIIRTLKIRA